MIQNWTQKCYARLLIDNHITDVKPEFMRRFSPAEYVRMVKLGGIESAMVYACDHNGNCYYPTKVGHTHGGLRGRNIFGETVRLLAKNKIVPVAYYTIIFHNDAAHRIAGSQSLDFHGKTGHSRYYRTCPNNPAVNDFYKKQIAEIFDHNPDLCGIFVDMLFWGNICFCPNCKKKYKALHGLDLPKKIDWKSPDWMRFQRFREACLAEVAKDYNEFINKHWPDKTLTFQFGPILTGWRLAETSSIAPWFSYPSGDFYGGKLQQRLGTKVFDAYCHDGMPYEWMTSRCERLMDHTSTKSEDDLRVHALTTLANNGVYFFIDAINPDGTLEEKFYTTLGRVARSVKPFRETVKRHAPRPLAEVGIYYAPRSSISLDCQDETLPEYLKNNTGRQWHMTPTAAGISGLGDLLCRLNIPYRAILDTDTDYSDFKTIILDQGLCLSPEEVARLRQFVSEGGTLIATGKSSLYPLDGNYTDKFALADVLGVQYTGKDTGIVSYLQMPDGEKVSSPAICPIVRISSQKTKVLAHLNLPDFPIGHPTQYASIHSNPPAAEATKFVAWTEHLYGRGLAVYLYSDIFASRQAAQIDFSMRLLSRYLPKFVTSSKNLPPCVEVTYQQSTTNPQVRLLNLVNYQDSLPNIPIHDLSLTIPIHEKVKSIHRASNGKPATYRCKTGQLTIELPRLEDAEFFEIEFV